MTDRVKALLKQLKDREYRNKRRDIGQIEFVNDGTAFGYANDFKTFVSKETPVLYDNDSFGFNRSITARNPWGNGNVCPNYYSIISAGFDEVSDRVKAAEANTHNKEKKEFANAMLSCIDTVFEVAEGYRDYAKQKGEQRLYKALCNIPHKGARDFYEALVFLKLCVYSLRACAHVHITFGRFDMYMYPFYLKSVENGMTKDEALELIEEFFISINMDTDLYHGIQLGDNGQSMVLGGFDSEGRDMYNELSDLCLDASLELSLIDPKINLRVGKNTPCERFVKGTHLTKAGLGFPQYCNDDVVIPGLEKLGYSKEDAVNYVVAACWEYIVPNNGADIPNISNMDFPKVVNDAVFQSLENAESFDEVLEAVKQKIALQCDVIAKEQYSHAEPSCPYLSLFFEGCIQNLTNVYGGTKYYNFGCHGAGIANAADALAAVRKCIFEDKSLTKEQLLEAVSNNFEGMPEIRNMLLSCPKMGNNCDEVDSLASLLMHEFAKNLNGKPNGHGGIWRAGTGSAMEYIRLGEVCPATADGRYAFTPYPSSFSPSITAKTKGLLSVLQSFTKHDMTEIINGGPVSIEIHDTVLKNDVGIQKTAMLVNEFINLGGHQLQLNSVNRDRLVDAQLHPENHPNLIVRVWGWSGYFNELDVKYQNHIISRCEYTV